MDQLLLIAAGAAAVVGALTRSTRIGAVAGVLVYLAMMALRINR